MWATDGEEREATRGADSGVLASNAGDDEDGN